MVMLALGVVLLLLCLLLAGSDQATLEVFGVDITGFTVGGLVLLGAGLGLVAMLALVLILSGAARKRAKRNKVKQVGRERETLAEENARLQAELQERGAHAYPEPTVGPSAPVPPVAPPSPASSTEISSGGPGPVR
jgi:membrane protein implicated in regulation of membrane protease activity